MDSYRPRLVDELLRNELEAFGAVQITGPKWCGKTTTASRLSNSIIFMQDPDFRDTYKQVADTKPSELLKGDNPRLIDEWQTAPKLWDAVRLAVDLRNQAGLFILTGSVSMDPDETDEIEHSGTGRINTIRMGTMSLFESGDSNGCVSLDGLFSGSEPAGFSDKTLDDVAYMLIRGGWPQTIGKSRSTARTQIKGYCNSILDTRMELDGKRRDPHRMALIMRSLSRNISAPLSKATIIGDVSEGNSIKMSPNTLDDYLNVLRRIHVLETMPSWNPNLRSKTAIRTSPTIHFCDPAVAAYFLSAHAEDLIMDPNTFGLLFESLVVRDLRVYAQCLEGEVSHYRDKSGLEADAVVHLPDGKWGAFEVKLSNAGVEDGARNLKKLAEKIDTDRMNGPSFLAVIVPCGYAFTREDGVHVIPITCLRE